ncbi:MAG TPA: hypothetical protein VK780_06745 [Thermoanaerobaculia bacterium]|nr:hypothetical protein [Thermoanaerobaculia bacterium]
MARVAPLGRFAADDARCAGRRDYLDVGIQKRLGVSTKVFGFFDFRNVTEFWSVVLEFMHFVPDRGNPAPNRRAGRRQLGPKLHSEEMPMDARSVLAASTAFFRSHELQPLARELPAEVTLSAEGQSRCEQALSEGFDSAFVFPSVAAQKLHFEAIVLQLATAPAFGLSKKEQYTPAAIPDLRTLKTTPARSRPTGCYVLFYRTTPFPRETREKSAADIDRLFSALGWTGLTVPEYIVLQRLLAEKNGDHRFDLYAPDAARSQWQWLLDTRLPSGAVMAFWNPQGCRLEVGPAPAEVSTARRGAHPTVIVPVG